MPVLNGETRLLSTREYLLVVSSNKVHYTNEAKMMVLAHAELGEPSCLIRGAF